MYNWISHQIFIDIHVLYPWPPNVLFCFSSSSCFWSLLFLQKVQFFTQITQSSLLKMKFATSLQSLFASPHPARCPAIVWHSLSTITTEICASNPSHYPLEVQLILDLIVYSSTGNHWYVLSMDWQVSALLRLARTQVRRWNQALFGHDLWKLSLFHQFEMIALERRYYWPTVRINARPFVWLFLRLLAYTSHKNDSFNVLTVASRTFILFPFGYDYWFPVRSRSGESSHHTCVERSINAWYLRSSAITIDWNFLFLWPLQQRYLSLFIHVSSSRSTTGDSIRHLEDLIDQCRSFFYVHLSLGFLKKGIEYDGEPPSCYFLSQQYADKHFFTPTLRLSFFRSSTGVEMSSSRSETCIHFSIRSRTRPR